MFLPLELTLRPSRIYAGILALVHVLAFFGVWLAALPPGLQAALGLALAAGGMRVWRGISGGPRALRVSSSGEVEVFAGRWQAARISGRPVVLPWLVSLALRPETGGVLRLVLLPDSAEREALRRLRVWLLWGWRDV